MPCADVVVQPHRRQLALARVADIRRTLRQHGQLESSAGAAVAYRPSVGWVLVGGEHRWAAACAPGAKLSVYVLRHWDDFVAWAAVDMLDKRRTGWDPVTAVFMYEKVVAALRPGRADQPLADIAEFTGIHRGVLESVRWANALIADLDESADVREYTRGLLDELEAGAEGGHSVRERVARFKAKKANAGRPPESAAVQRKALASVPQLTGIVGALAELGPINPEIPKTERDAYAAQLGALGALLAKIKKNLRGESA